MLDIDSMLQGKERVKNGLPYKEKKEINETITEFIRTPLPPCETCGKTDVCECRTNVIARIMIEDFFKKDAF